MSVKHTPGPWQMDTAGRNIFMVFPENDPECATIVASNIRVEADARLIAKAPDMVTALRVGLFHTQLAAARAVGLAQWNKNDGKDGIAAEYERLASESEQAAHFIRNTITQATGEQA